MEAHVVCILISQFSKLIIKKINVITIPKAVFAQKNLIVNSEYSLIHLIYAPELTLATRKYGS